MLWRLNKNSSYIMCILCCVIPQEIKGFAIKYLCFSFLSLSHSPDYVWPYFTLETDFLVGVLSYSLHY